MFAVEKEQREYEAEVRRVEEEEAQKKAEEEALLEQLRRSREGGEDLEDGFEEEQGDYEYADPNDWEECQDDEGNVFWYQISTGESSWDTPVFPPAQAQAQAEDGFSAAVQVQGGGEKAEEWEEVMDDASGEAYYYNVVSGESQWEKPEALKSAFGKLRMLKNLGAFGGAATDVGAHGGGDGGDGGEEEKAEKETAVAESDTQAEAQEWEEVIDDESGEAYYYNNVTGTSQWEKPEALKSAFGKLRMLKNLGAFGGASAEAGADGGGGGGGEEERADEGKNNVVVKEDEDEDKEEEEDKQEHKEGEEEDKEEHKEEAGDEEGEEEEQVDWESKRPFELKQELSRRGLETKGKKKELIKRLQESDIQLREEADARAAEEAAEQWAAQEAAAALEEQSGAWEEQEEVEDAYYEEEQQPVWEQVDDGAGNLYYYNTSTGESSWEQPANFVPATAAAAAADTAQEEGEEWTAETQVEQQEWEEVISDEGTYYYNNVTGESSWERPAAMG